MTGARKPGPRGERAISRKPLRGECRAFSGVTWLTRVRFYPIILHTRLSGASGARHSPRPLIGEGGTSRPNLARSKRRDREVVSRRHCEARSDEAIHSFFVRYDGLLRSARNDGFNPGCLKYVVARRFTSPACGGGRIASIDAIRVGEGYPLERCVLRRHPHPGPPPQAGEGAHRRCRGTFAENQRRIISRDTPTEPACCRPVRRWCRA